MNNDGRPWTSGRCVAPGRGASAACALLRRVRHTPGMASYQQRKAIGGAHEEHVAHELTLRGWDVSPWGQGTLTANVAGSYGQQTARSGGCLT